MGDKVRRSPHQVKCTDVQTIFSSQPYLFIRECVTMQETIRSVLEKTNSKFFHATQLKDFSTYCKEKAVLCRAELTAHGAYTPLYTDESDREKGVWNRLFGNIEDFGRLFWSHDDTIPNAYGPITLVFPSTVWSHLDDIAVSKRGAADSQFTLSADRMSPDELLARFEKVDAGYRQKEYGLEVSSSSQRLAFSNIAYILVDPVESSFAGRVRVLATGAGLRNAQIIQRTNYGEPLPSEKLEIYHELVEWANSLRGKPPLSKELPSKAPESLKSWIKNVPEGRRRALRPCLEYLFVGTLSEIRQRDR